MLVQSFIKNNLINLKAEADQCVWLMLLEGSAESDLKKEINLAFDKKPEKPQNKSKKFNPTIIDGGKK